MEQKQKIVIFPKQKTKETDPNFTGQIQDENGKPIKNVVLWLSTSKNGIEYFKGWINEYREKQ